MSVDYRPEYDPADVDSDYGHTGGDITVPTFTANMKPFRFWCQKALPLVYDDSLSYYEVLCKVVKQMNDFLTDLQTATGAIDQFAQQFVINQQFLNDMADQLGQNVQDLEDYINDRLEDYMTAYTQLQDYVNDYFDNLDVQQQINNKLDEMALDGTFNTLFDPVITAWMTTKTAQIDAAISAQNAVQAQQNGRISTLESRMDTFASLPSGSTSGNAELLDIRTNFLGETYPTAGDAVRASDMIASGFQAIPVTLISEWDGNDESSPYDTIQIDVSSYKGGHIVVIGTFLYFQEDLTNLGKCSVYATNVAGATEDTNAVNYMPGPTSVFKSFTQITTDIQGEERLILQFAIPDDYTYQYLKIGHIEHNPNPAYHTDPLYIVYGNSWSKTPVDDTLSIAGDAADAKATGDALEQLNERIDNVTKVTKNLFDINALKSATVSVVNGVATGIASAFHTSFRNGIPLDITFEPNTQYTLSLKAKNDTGGNSAGLLFIIHYTDETSSILSLLNSYTEYISRSITSTAGKTIKDISASYMSEGNYVWHVTEIQLEKGTVATTFIPHESALDNVAREENATIISQIKDYNVWNYLNFNYASRTINGVTVEVNNGVLTVDGKLTDTGTYFDLYSGSIVNTGLVPGKTYFVNTGLHGREVDGIINIYTNNGSGNTLRLNNGIGIQKVVIPADTQAIIIRYFPPNTNNVSVNHRFTFTEKLPNELLDNIAEMRFLRAWGTGDCTIIKFKNGENLIIDFGLNEAQGTLQSSWATAISQMGITHIDYAIISHYHGDHVGMLLYGISSLLDENTVFFTARPYTEEDLEGLAWMDSMSGDHVVENYTAVTQILETAGVKRVYPVENNTYVIGNAEIQFWNTNHQEWLDMFIAHTMYDYNHCSLCNYVTIGRERIAFTGDIGSYVMEKYQTTVLPSQIFKVNHHSAGYAVNNIFLNSLMPELDITMLGHALGTLENNSPNQVWCEANFVPNVVTGINDRTLILEVSSDSYKWVNSVRKCIVADEEALANS